MMSNTDRKVSNKNHQLHIAMRERVVYGLNILASGNRNSGALETYIPDTETAFDWLNYHP